MFKGKKVIVVMPAYNAAKTLRETHAEVMAQGVVDQVILVDDGSRDDTVDIARGLPHTFVHVHEANRGYGGNQKSCYRLALEHGGDIIIMVHPDYQYTPQLLPAMVSIVGNDLYPCVLGSRILGGYALRGGMPLWKYIANRFLTFTGNLLMGAKLSEYHTGYRAFSRQVLQSLPLEMNSDDFVYDNQMLAQILWQGYTIAEVTCPTKYFAEASSINLRRSIKYGCGCVMTAVKFRLAKMGLASKAPLRRSIHNRSRDLRRTRRNRDAIVPAMTSTSLIERHCWCGATAAHPAGAFHLDDGKNFDLVRCDGCGVFALFPQPTDEELLHSYSSEYYGSSRRKFIGPIAKLISMFQGGRARLAARHAPRGGRVLDIGCGNGGFLIQMKHRGFQAEGTEWTAESAARVPAEEKIPIHVGDLLTVDLPEKSYDLITLWHVFEHLRKPDAIVEKINRLLKPGGSLLLSLPNAESSQARRFKTHWLHHDPPRHLFGFGPQSLTALLKPQGFEVVSVGTFSLEQNPFGFVQSWLNSRSHPRDRLYTMLKGLSHDSASTRVADLFWLAALGMPALVISSLESMRGRGATMIIRARLSAHG